MNELPAGGSLYALLGALAQVLRALVGRPVAIGFWPALREMAGAARAGARALWLVAMPLLAMTAGNLMLFGGQGLEFLREFILSTEDLSPFTALLRAKSWWLAGVSVWTLAVWYCARILLSRLYARNPQAPDWVRLWEDLVRAYLPRLLALACVVPVSLAIGVLVAPPTSHPPLVLPQLSLLLGSMLGFTVVLDGHRAPRWFNIVVATLALGSLALALARSSDGPLNPALWSYFGSAGVVLLLMAFALRVPWLRTRWGRLAGLLLLAAAWLLGVAGVWRIGARVTWLPTVAMGSALALYALLGWRRELMSRLRRRVESTPAPAPADPVSRISRSQVVVMTTAIAASFMLAGLLYARPIEAGRAIGAPSIGLLALASLCLFFSLVLVLLPRAYGWPSLVMPALLSAAVVGYLDPYRPVPGLSLRIGPDPRPELAGHFAEWKRRRGATDDDPVIVVAAEGGGVRAAVWTAFALARLNDATCGEFERRLYAISSVSGGSLGAAFFTAQLAELPPRFAAERPGCWLQGSRASTEALHFFLNDFISPVLGSYLFGDLMRQFPGPNLIPGGRGRVLEATWEHDWADGLTGLRAGPNRFAQGYLDLYRGEALYQLPLLFLNATTVEDGKRAIAAPVRAAHVDAFDLFHERLATEGLKLSTAVHNSARFPFVSPPAFIQQRGDDPTDALKPWGRVVDGGYFENSGAETAREIVEQIAAAQGGRRSNIHVLILSNAPRNPEERLCHEILQEAGNTAPPLCRADTVKGDAPPNAWLPDLNAPAETLMATREARGSLAKVQLAQAIGDPARVHELYLAKWGRAYTDPPLGWFLSGQGITGIDDALSPMPKSVKEPQPARLALQRLAWTLVMPMPYAPADDAATLERKRARFLCDRAGGKDCGGERS